MNTVPRMDDSLMCRLMNVRIIGSGRLPKEDMKTIDDAIEAINHSEVVKIDGGEYAVHPVVAAELLRLHMAAKQRVPSDPIDMVLHCPTCGMQHIDAPEEHSAVLPRNYGHWSNPPHRSHLCHGCGHIWRPADVPTNGVAAVKTTGKQDSPVQQASEVEKFMDSVFRVPL